MLHANVTEILALLLLLVPMIAFGLAQHRMQRAVASLPVWSRLALPGFFVVPYLCVTLPVHTFAWHWFLLYALIPAAIAGLLHLAAKLDPAQRGTLFDFFILLALGLAVDLRWLESAWPRGLQPLGKLLLLDAGMYGFFCVRQLTDVGYDLRLRLSDWKTGLRELLLYMPIALALGFSLGFLHMHFYVPNPLRVLAAWLFTFFFIAIPEEVFFRGWMQNLLARRIGTYPALGVTAVLFGLSHFNKITHGFNWRYVLLAAIAGIFYGRSYLSRQRVSSSAITHASVDTLWSIWLR